MLYVLLDGESALAGAVLEKSGIACDALLESFSTRLNKEGTNKLEPGKRPVASRALRELIEKSFEKMTARGVETAEPIDFVLAAVDYGEAGLKGELRGAGATKQALEKRPKRARPRTRHWASRARRARRPKRPRRRSSNASGATSPRPPRREN